MKKIVLSSIAVIGVSLMTLAQKDTVKTPVIKDTIKSKQTGAIYSIENMLAFGPQTDSTKKVAPKPDTLKTGSVELKSSMYYAFVGPQTDSIKGKVKSDTIKSETKMNSTGYLPVSSSMIALFDGPQTDSTKVKSTPAKPDSTTTKPVDKRTGSIQMDRSLLKNEILEA